MSRFTFAALFACASTLAPGISAQQAVDSSFHPRVERPVYPAGTGPVVLFDEAHNSFHSLGRSFRPFAELLRLDGYRVAPLAAKLSAAALTDADILVIVNVLAAENVGNWKLPTPSAYTPDEIEAVRRWVNDGGSLLTFRPGIITYEPTVAWQFDGVPAGSAAGMLQGAARVLAAGRVVVLGEAAMLTAQVAGPNRRPMGMNAPVARQNQRFVLNLMHWLSGGPERVDGESK
ncbi:MAG: hypothetical protein WEA80_04775 [Gemmatimonadaceae bacterium]